jgi:hypothetical protein
MILTENFHFEIIRRHSLYPDHYSFIQDWLKSVNNKELKIDVVNSLNLKLKNFYGIPKIVNNKWIDEFGSKLVENICKSWELPNLTRAPIPWNRTEGLDREIFNKPVDIIASIKTSGSKKKRYSHLEQLEANYKNGARLFLAIYPSCTEGDILKQNWNQLIKKAYLNPKTKGKRSWKRDILLWDLVKLQKPLGNTNKKFFNDLKKSHPEFKSIQPSSIERQFNRTVSKIADYPIKIK